MFNGVAGDVLLLYFYRLAEQLLQLATLQSLRENLIFPEPVGEVAPLVDTISLIPLLQ